MNLSLYSSAEFRTALKLVWIFVTLVTALALVTPFVVPAATIARLVPPCESKRLYGRPCFLCGTTTGFIAIAHGDWASAAQSNLLAIPLFAVFSLNALAAIAYLSRRKRVAMEADGMANPPTT